MAKQHPATQDGADDTKVFVDEMIPVTSGICVWCRVETVTQDGGGDGLS